LRFCGGRTRRFGCKRSCIRRDRSRRADGQTSVSSTVHCEVTVRQTNGDVDLDWHPSVFCHISNLQRRTLPHLIVTSELPVGDRHNATTKPDRLARSQSRVPNRNPPSPPLHAPSQAPSPLSRSVTAKRAARISPTSFHPPESFRPPAAMVLRLRTT
jgi:hypothetical protein